VAGLPTVPPWATEGRPARDESLRGNLLLGGGDLRSGVRRSQETLAEPGTTPHPDPQLSPRDGMPRDN
jgi:hypothetical protein